MADMTWLAQEAKVIHSTFSGVFYLLVTVFLSLGIFLEYFKWPLGLVPSFSQLVGRALVAVLLLHFYPEITNTVADVTDAVAAQLGDLNKIKLVTTRMAEEWKDLSWSWISVKDSILMVISFVGFFVLYFSVYVTEAFFLWSWTLLYVFSPILIALFVLPATAGATRALFQSIFEIACWKIVWAVLATLLWSAALSDINDPQTQVSFLTAICYNLILAASLLLTPFIVHSLSGSGLASFTRTVGSVAIGGLTLNPKIGAVMAARKGRQLLGSNFDNSKRSKKFSGGTESDDDGPKPPSPRNKVKKKISPSSPTAT